MARDGWKWLANIDLYTCTQYGFQLSCWSKEYIYQRRGQSAHVTNNLSHPLFQLLLLLLLLTLRPTFSDARISLSFFSLARLQQNFAPLFFSASSKRRQMERSSTWCWSYHPRGCCRTRSIQSKSPFRTECRRWLRRRPLIR
jgi:hypothetical protein